MDRGAAHDPSVLLTWNLRAFGRNPRRSKTIGPPKDLRTNGPSHSAIKTNTDEHSNVSSYHSVANFVLHSSGNTQRDGVSSRQPLALLSFADCHRVRRINHRHTSGE